MKRLLIICVGTVSLIFSAGLKAEGCQIRNSNNELLGSVINNGNVTTSAENSSQLTIGYIDAGGVIYRMNQEISGSPARAVGSIGLDGAILDANRIPAGSVDGQGNILSAQTKTVLGKVSGCDLSKKNDRMLADAGAFLFLLYQQNILGVWTLYYEFGAYPCTGLKVPENYNSNPIDLKADGSFTGATGTVTSASWSKDNKDIVLNFFSPHFPFGTDVCTYSGKLEVTGDTMKGDMNCNNEKGCWVAIRP